jgi:hypothetical protein
MQAGCACIAIYALGRRFRGDERVRPAVDLGEICFGGGCATSAVEKSQHQVGDAAERRLQEA